MRYLLIGILGMFLVSCVTTDTSQIAKPRPSATPAATGSALPFANPHRLPLAELPAFGGGPLSPVVERFRADYRARTADRMAQIGRSTHDAATVMAVDGMEALHRAHDPRRAVTLLNAAWMLDPDVPEIWLGFANVVRIRDSDNVGAEAMFRRGLALPTTSADVYAAYGDLLLSTKRPQEALRLLREGHAKFPTSQVLIGHLALAEVDTGDAAGCARIRSVLDQAPAYSRAQFMGRLNSPLCR